MHESLLEDCLDELVKSVSDMNLNEPKLFITFVPQDLPEQPNSVIKLAVFFDCIDDRCCPLNDQVLQTVSLIKVSVHVLFHSLSRKFVLFALLVVFDLLLINISDNVSNLLQ